MAIAWIATRTESRLIEAFLAPQWEIQVFPPKKFLKAKSSKIKNIDVIVFELLDGSTLDVCQEICDKKTAPMLVIVADLAYAQAMLEAGTDDFLVAPYNPIEALLRVHKLTRALNIVRVGELEIGLAAWRAVYAGRRVHLTPLEFRLLACLAKRVGQMVSHAEILEEVWEWKREYGSLGRLKNCIGRIRRKIEPDFRNPQYLITIPGGGYRLRNQRQWEADQRDMGS
jgi:two-component system, OmpR family, response regulator MtrA